MIADRDHLLTVLQTLPRKVVHGPWSRAVGFHLLLGPPPGAAPGSSPQPLWPGGASLKGARFTTRGGAGSLYLATDPVTALHEVVSVFTPPGGHVFTLKTSPWVVITVEGVLSNMVDLSDPENQTKLQTSLAELTGDWAYTQSISGQAPTQILGQAAFDCGILGFEYSSARNVGSGTSIVVFTNNLIANKPSFLEVFDEYHHLTHRLP